MNMFKNAGGFTLVELIVVIAILAILASVAVPAYSGYINEANKTADDQKIEALNTAIAAAVSMEGKNVSEADTYFDVTFDATTGTLEIAKTDDDDKGVDAEIWTNFTNFGGEQSITLNYYKTVADVEDIVDGIVVTAAPENP